MPSAAPETLRSQTTAEPAKASGRSWYSHLSLPRLADYLVVAVAISLPWSTSATSILILLWLLVLIPTLDFAELRRELLTPAGGLPVLLWVLAAAGTLWADVGWADRLYGLRYYHKLLVIPLLLIQFRRSPIGWHVLTGFLASCTVLLALSWILKLWPSLHWSDKRALGIPTKDRIVQAVEFVICAGVLLHLAIGAWESHKRALAIALTALACLFLGNVLVVSLARTALVVVPCLLLLIGFQRFGVKGAIGLLASGAILGTAVWAASPALRASVYDAISGIGELHEKTFRTSSGIRLEYWRQSLEFIAEAPVIGNGTGSTRALSLEAVREDGVGQSGTIPHNPHNQMLAVGIQLGFVGIAVLLAFWCAHFALFWGSGLTHWLGTLLVLQNVLSSLTNSHLFDFTPGWIYVFGVGVLGGMAIRQRSDTGPLAKRPAEAV